MATTRRAPRTTVAISNAIKEAGGSARSVVVLVTVVSEVKVTVVSEVETNVVVLGENAVVVDVVVTETVVEMGRSPQ